MLSIAALLCFIINNMIIVLIADWWVLWLGIYYVQTIDGAILVMGDAGIFERNYLVPAQIFIITIAFTISSFLLFRKLRKKQLISRKYIAPTLFNTLPLWLMSISQIEAMIYYLDWIY